MNHVEISVVWLDEYIKTQSGLFAFLCHANVLAHEHMFAPQNILESSK